MFWDLVESARRWGAVVATFRPPGNQLLKDLPPKFGFHAQW